jgi:hypothetical protein
MDAMARSEPPESPDLAMRIACDAASRVDVDLAALVSPVAQRLRTSSGRRDWIETEEFALEALGGLWDGELRERCARALADVHEAYVLQAATVDDARQALKAEGRDAWIAGAIVFELAGRLAWKVLDAEGLLFE